MTTNTTILKIGNSSGVIIPAAMMKYTIKVHKFVDHKLVNFIITAEHPSEG